MSDNPVLKPGSYRVWDTIGGAYCHEIFDMPFLDERGELWFMSPGCERMDSQKGINCVNLTRDFQPGRYQVERWTGLYDHDQNPLYEGDVGLTHDHQVRIHYEGGQFWLVEIPTSTGHFDGRIGPFRSQLTILRASAVWLFGTIHDEPEALMKAGKVLRKSLAGKAW